MGPVAAGFRRTAAVTVLIGVLAGCGAGTTSPKQVAVDAPLAEECGDVPEGAIRVTVPTTDARRLGAALVGDRMSRTGAVLAHGKTQSLCDWLAVADRWGRSAHARILVVDRRGTGSSPGPRDMLKEPGDLVQAAAVLRGQGVTSVALMGSSMGSVSALVAASPQGPRRAIFPHDDRAPVLPTPPCATVLVSPILDWEETTGTVSALAAPTLPDTVWVAYEKNNSSIVADVARLRTRLSGASSPKRSGAAVKELTVTTSDHSLALVKNHNEVLPFLTKALSSCR